MGFMDKLMFWKKKDEFSDLGLKGSDFGLGGGPDLGLHDAGMPKNDFGSHDLGLGPEPRQPMQQPFQPPQQPSYPQPPQPSFQSAPVPQQPMQQERSRDESEIVASKLDVIKAKLDSIEQRLANLERIAQGEHEPKRRTW